MEVEVEAVDGRLKEAEAKEKLTTIASLNEGNPNSLRLNPNTLNHHIRPVYTYQNTPPPISKK